MFTRHTGFLGLQPNLTVPPPNSAKDCKNMIRDRVRGRLRLSPGYSKRYDLPFPTFASDEHRFNNLQWLDIHEITVPNHGGRNITMAVGSYKKLSDNSADTGESRIGIWVRPYWSGSAWVDSWIELTENYIFTVNSVGTNDIDVGVDVVLDPTTFGSNALANWLAVFVDTSGADPIVQVIPITGSSLTTTTNLHLLLASLSYAPWNGSKVLVMRDAIFRCSTDVAGVPQLDMPSSFSGVDIFCESIQGEGRVNTGNDTKGFSLMIGFRERTLGFAGPRNTYDRLICENACLREMFSSVSTGGGFSSYTISSTLTQGTHAGNGLENGTYGLKAWLVLEDGQEIDPILDMGSEVISASDKALEYTIVLSGGWMSNRARYVRIAISKNSSSVYNTVALLDLKDAIWTYSYLNNTLTSSTQVIGLLEFKAIDALISAQMGRDPVAVGVGIVRYLRSAIFGKQRILSGVTVDGIAYPNTMFMNVASGDGAIQWDIFPGGESGIVDVEYSDGDHVILPVVLRERIVVFKNRRIISLTPDGAGGFNRDVVTAEVGLCSTDGVSTLRDFLYWPDHSGIYSFSYRGYEMLNPTWIEEWKSLTDIQRAGTKSIVDKLYNKIIFSVPIGASCINYIYDVNDGEWMKEVPASVPQRFNRGSVDTVQWLNGSEIKIVDFTKILQSSVSVPFFYEWNPVRNEKGARWDILANTVYLSYISTVGLTLDFYLDDVLVQSYSLVAGTAAEIIPLPLSSVCKKFRFKISGLAIAENDYVEIEEEGYDFEYIPAGGDQLRY